MKNVIVSGANGFIGKKLCQELIKKGYHVTALVRHDCSELSELGCKVYTSMPEILAESQYETFFHLAWEGAGGPKRADIDVQMSNVKSTMAYYSLAERSNCKRFIAIGTIAQKTLEEHNAAFYSKTFVYAATKNYTKTLLEIAAQNSRCQFVWATLCGIYGVGDTTGNIINYTLKGLSNHQKVEFGPADNWFDFVYIDDVVNALILLGKSKLSKNDYQIGSGNPRLLKEFLIEAGAALNKKDLIQIGARPDDGIRYQKEWFSIDALVHDTGYQSSVSFQDGLNKTLEWLLSEEKRYE